MITILIVLSIIVLLLLLYFLIVRPRTLTWGAAPEEAALPLTGDDVVEQPHFIATRAVTVHAPPSQVWKWIIQIGSKRAGWYSIDWIDNAGEPSSRMILPEFQKITEGAFIPFTPDQKNGMWVKSYKEHEYILWWDKKERSTWLWYLADAGQGNTRLITRLRTKYDFSFPWVIYYMLYDFGDIIMMRRCMLGIKERAEGMAT